MRRIGVTTVSGDKRYDRPVSNVPPPTATTAPQPSPVAPNGYKAKVPWPAYAALVISLIAVSVAIGSWVRPPSATSTASTSTAPAYTDRQITDAKAKVCAAFANVHQAVRSNFARDHGDDPNQQLLVAVTGQQALLAGSVHLQTTLSEQPAAPAELATAVRKLVDVFQSLTVDYLNGHGSPEVDPSLRAGDEATLTIQSICK